MAQANNRVRTPVTVWLGHLSMPRVTFWHTKVFLLALGYLLMSLVLGVICNVSGWKAGAIVVLGIFSVIDYWILTSPWPFGGTSILGFLRGQPGFDKGWSIDNGVKQAEQWLNKLYTGLTYTILGRHAALVVLVFLPIEGFEDQFLFALCVSPLVILGSLKFTTRAWVIEWIWYGYIAIFVANIAYWIAVWQVPSWRQSEARQEIARLDTVAANRSDAALHERVRILVDTFENLPADLRHLSREEWEATLTQKDRADLQAAREGNTAVKIYNDAAPAVVNGTKEGAEVVLSWYQRGFDFYFYGEVIDIPITSLETKEFCDARLPKNGEVEFTLLREADPIIHGPGVGRVLTYFRINGKKVGHVQVRNHCVKVGFALTEAAYRANRIEHSIFSVEFKAPFWHRVLWTGGLALIVLFVLPWVGRRVPIIRRAFGNPAPKGH